MATEGFPVARIDEYAKPCEPAIHVLRSVVDVPDGPQKSDFKSNLTLYQFLPNFPPISIPFSKEKHPVWTKLHINSSLPVLGT